MKLIRLVKFEVKTDGGVGTFSQFQLDIEHRQSKIKTITSVGGEELYFQHTKLSGYITINIDIAEIIVLFK